MELAEMNVRRSRASTGYNLFPFSLKEKRAKRNIYTGLISHLPGATQETTGRKSNQRGDVFHSCFQKKKLSQQHLHNGYRRVPFIFNSALLS